MTRGTCSWQVREAHPHPPDLASHGAQGRGRATIEQRTEQATMKAVLTEEIARVRALLNLVEHLARPGVRDGAGPSLWPMAHPVLWSRTQWRPQPAPSPCDRCRR
jgi:hypothetical protein